MTSNAKAPVRVAIRDHGEYIHFYLADGQTMDDAILLVLARRDALMASPPLFEAIKGAVVQYLTEMAGRRGVRLTGWTEVPGPPGEMPQ